MHFEGFHFVDSALVAWGTTEASAKKCFDQFPGQREPDHLSTEAKYIHVVVFHALVGRENIMDEPCTYTRNLVSAYRRPHAAAAERDLAFH